jgi:hypothetical protein
MAGIQKHRFFSRLTLSSTTFFYILYQIRAIWYLNMKALIGDEEFQKRGMTVCRYSLGAEAAGHLHLDFVIKAARLAKAMPIKTMGYHYCYDDVKLRPLLATLQMFGGRNLRLRFRAHFGKNLYILCSTVLYVRASIYYTIQFD